MPPSPIVEATIRSEVIGEDQEPIRRCLSFGHRNFSQPRRRPRRHFSGAVSELVAVCRQTRIAGSSSAPLKLVFVDNHRLVAGGGDPFLHRRKRHDRLAVGIRVALELELVGPKPGHERGVGRIRNAEMTK